MYHTSREKKGLRTRIQSRTKHLSPLLFVLLAAVFATSLFLVSKPSIAATSNDTVSYDTATQTLNIPAGTVQATDIYTVGAAAHAADMKAVVFAGDAQVENTAALNAQGHGLFEDSSVLESVTINGTISFPGDNASLSAAFDGCSALKTLDASHFNTDNVTETVYMFSNCSSLESVNISSFNTSNVQSMSSMFSGCESLKSLDFPKTFTTEACKDFEGIFESCEELTSLDLSTFSFKPPYLDEGEGLSMMFLNCNKLSEINLGNLMFPGLYDSETGMSQDLAAFASSYADPDGHDVFTYPVALSTVTMQAGSLPSPAVWDKEERVYLGSYFDYEHEGGWNAYQNDVYQAHLSSRDDFANYQKTHPGATTYKWGEEPAPVPTDTVTLTFAAGEGSWNGAGETTLTGAPDAAIIAPVYPAAPAEKICVGWFDESGRQIVSGVTKFSEVTGVVTARFTDAPGWHQNATGWWYVYDLKNNYYTNCWALINSAWFYFNDAGYCLEYTWGYINGEWYFFGWGGYMQTGWQWLGGNWYFLDRNSGAMKCGWVHDGVWYYCDAALGGAMYDNCWAYINGNWYGFNEGGSMTQGWSYSYSYDGWFYLDPETGHMLYSWQYIGGHWYYFYNNGLMAANTYVGTYWLGSDGAMW